MKAQPGEVWTYNTDFEIFEWELIAKTSEGWKAKLLKTSSTTYKGSVVGTITSISLNSSRHTNVAHRWKRLDAPVSPVKYGSHCKRCNDFNSYAEPNQPDDSYICYGCRK